MQARMHRTHALSVSLCSLCLCGSSLMRTELTYSDALYDYQLAVCGPLTDGPCCSATTPTNVSSCQAQPNSSYGPWSAGFWAPASTEFQFIDATRPNAGVMYSMQGASTCYLAGGYQPYVSNVLFVCAASAGPMSVVTEAESCVQNYTIPTPLACASPPPPCGFNGLDFSSLAGQPLLGTDGSSLYNYFVSVCAPLPASFAATVNCTSVDAAASTCQQQVSGGEYGAYVLGDWSNPAWGLIESGEPAVGVQVVLQSTAQQCYLDSQPYSATIQFVCAQNQGHIKVVQSPNACSFTMVLPTPLACGGGAIEPKEERIALM